MIPQSERLKDRRIFNLVFNPKNQSKQRVSSSMLTLYYYLFRKKDINMFPKVAFIVGVKIDKKSTKRNLIKRRMRAAYGLIKKTDKMRILSFSVLIWIANPGIKNATFEQIKSLMNSLLTKIRI